MDILALQIDIAWEDKPANHRKVRAMLDDARPEPGTLVVLPEMFSTGFSMNVAAVSDTPGGEDHAFLTALAKERDLWILAGTVVTGPEGKGRNHALLVSPLGREVARYTKLHPFAPGKEAAHYLAGDAVLLADVHHTKVAPFICYDLRFPEAFRRATRLGAEVLIVIANWPEARIHHWTALLQARAIENQAYVLGVNRTGRDPYLAYPGRSALFGPRGELVAQLDAAESSIRATLDPQVVRAWRQEFPFLNDMRTDLLR
jgi:predicted amidohydrolase